MAEASSFISKAYDATIKKIPKRLSSRDNSTPSRISEPGEASRMRCNTLAIKKVSPDDQNYFINLLLVRLYTVFLSMFKMPLSVQVK